MTRDVLTGMPSPGAVVGRFRLGKVVGRGSMAWVYEATELETGRAVAIKIMASKLMQSSIFRARFADEVRITSRLRHPNIVEVFDFIEQKEPPFLACVMERIPGESLLRAVRDAPLELNEALEVLSQLIDALRVVHTRGIVHRDLKPSNILLTGERPGVFATSPAIKIVDFGIAKSLESDAVTTQPGAVLGTPRYLAPEQVAGDPVSPATDVYALGEVLFEMLTGARLFEGDRNEVIRAKLLGYFPIERLRMLGDRPFSGKVASIVQACGREPQQRPTLDALLGRVDELRHGNFEPLANDTSSVYAPSPLLVVPVERLTEQDEASMVGTAVARHGEQEGRPWRLGRYTVFERLEGRGVVESFVARHDRDIEFCRLKRLMHIASNDPVAVGRFQREAQLALHLVHPNIGRVLRSSIEEGVFCIAQEWILGVPLARLLALLAARNRSMPLQIFAPIMFAVLDGLAHAHRARDAEGASLSIVHRNLTPSSIVISFSGCTKIRDFGEARAAIGEYRTSAGGEAIGSMDCSSPELLSGGAIDARSDVYSVAAIAYEMLAGQPVVAEGEVMDMLHRILEEDPPDLARLRPDIPPAVGQAIRRGLAKSPDARYATAERFREALGEAVGRFDEVTEDLVGDFVREVADVEEHETVVRLRRLRRWSLLRDDGETSSSTAPPRALSTGSLPTGSLPTGLLPGVGAKPLDIAWPGSGSRRRDSRLDPTPHLGPNPNPSPKPKAGLDLKADQDLDRRASRSWPARKMAYFVSTVVALAVGAASLATWVVVRSARERAASSKTTAPTPMPKATSNHGTKDATNDEPEGQRAPLESSSASNVNSVPESTAAPSPRLARPRAQVVARGAHSNDRDKDKDKDKDDDHDRDKEKSPEPPFSTLRGRIDALKRNPQDIAAFERVVADLRDASRDATPDVVRRVASDVAAAERTLEVSLLETALLRLTADWHRRHADAQARP
ncbi:MAG: serine/threonine protein kinase [Deltaproteobacteria bacterium]|nr:serine/threonine protein kinase [Deltaproteobacteria bacterium]